MPNLQAQLPKEKAPPGAPSPPPRWLDLAFFDQLFYGFIHQLLDQAHIIAGAYVLLTVYGCALLVD
jgi:hypothetical protein